jgi:hypothetical protein
MSTFASASSIDSYKSLPVDDVPIDRMTQIALHDILDNSTISEIPVYTNLADHYRLFCTDMVCSTEMHQIYKTALDKWITLDTDPDTVKYRFTTHDINNGHQMGTSSMYTMETKHNHVKIFIEKYDYEELPNEPNPGFSTTIYVSIIIEPKSTELDVVQIEESNRLKIYLEGGREEIVAKIRSINEVELFTVR